MKLTIITIFLMTAGFDFFLSYLNYRNRNAALPENVKDVFDKETYAKRNAYEMEKLRLNIIESICKICVTLAYLIFNIHSLLFEFSARFTHNLYMQTYFMLGVIMVISMAVGMPFEVIYTFKIEAKYGFNKSSAGTFVADTVKSLIISIILGGGLLTLFMLLYSKFGNLVFLIFYFVLVGLTVIIGFFAHFFSRIFNKFTPLEEGTLKDKISNLADKTGFPVKKIFIMDASKRSTKLNAYFTSFGKNKTIVLFDTMLEKLNEDEIVAVLTHEIGHFKKKHTVINMFLSLALNAILIFLSQFVITREIISVAFGFSGVNLAFGVSIFGIFFSPLFIILKIPLSALSRKFEYTADKFAALYSDKASLISSLKKLAGENYSNLTPHPFVELTSYSHPVLTKRIAKLD